MKLASKSVGIPSADFHKSLFYLLCLYSWKFNANVVSLKFQDTLFKTKN